MPVLCLAAKDGGEKAGACWAMAFFLSTFTNKVDKKGRVSVPASFRQAVASSHFPGIVVYRPLNFPCIEGADLTFLEQLSDRLYGDFGPFNPDQMSVATAILAGSSQLAFDPEGRVMLPAEMREAAGVDTHATFVGLGRKFQIWGADAYQDHLKSQLEQAAEAAPKLPPFGGGGQA